METSASRGPSAARRAAVPLSHGRKSGARGFTLMEMLAVLAVISVLAAVATPGFVEMIRERRTQREAAMFSDTSRVARARALGRGAAVAVIVDTANPPTALIYEHVDAEGLPMPGCRTQGVWRMVDRVNGRPNGSALTVISPADDTTPLARATVCYTPRGRTLWAANTGNVPFGNINLLPGSVTDTAAPNFITLAGVMRIQVQRAEGATAGQTRQIFVMSNGQTRVSL
jgi:prepilin-type N-terminal cleavage/methylation domain-containing protein